MSVRKASELVLFAALAFAAVGRMPAELDGRLIIGRDGVATVPLFNLWTMGWNADRLAHGFDAYWDAPIFFPARHAFAFSEAQPLDSLLAPIFWLSPAAAYNGFLILSLALNGWFARRLLTRLGLPGPAALGGGLLTTALPFVFGQVEALQLVPVWGILAAAAALWDHAGAPSVRSGLRLGLWFGVTYLVCNYYGLFLAVLAAPACAAIFGRRLFTYGFWRCSFLGASLALAMILPVVLEQIGASLEYRWTRDPAEVRALSADIDDYLVLPHTHLPAIELAGLSSRNPEETHWLAVGTLTLALAALGAAAGLSRSRTRQSTAGLAGLTLAAAALSMGPKFAPAGLSPFGMLQACVPGFGAIRSPFRFAVFVQIGLVVLAAGGLGAVHSAARAALQRLRSRTRVGRLRLAAAAVPIAMAGLAAYEVWPPQARLYTLPTREEHAGWVGWIREHTPPGLPVACLPPPRDERVASYQDTCLAMYCGLWHGRPMVDGYSGFFPPVVQAQRAALSTFPLPACLQTMADQGVVVYVVRRSAYGVLHAPFLEPVYQDRRAGIDIYAFDRPAWNQFRKLK